MTFGDKKVAKNRKYFIIDNFVTIVQAIKNIILYIFYYLKLLGDARWHKSRKKSQPNYNLSCDCNTSKLDKNYKISKFYKVL